MCVESELLGLESEGERGDEGEKSRKKTKEITRKTKRRSKKSWTKFCVSGRKRDIEARWYWKHLLLAMLVAV